MDNVFIISINHSSSYNLKILPDFIGQWIFPSVVVPLVCWHCHIHSEYQVGGLDKIKL